MREDEPPVHRHSGRASLVRQVRSFMTVPDSVTASRFPRRQGPLGRGKRVKLATATPPVLWSQAGRQAHRDGHPGRGETRSELARLHGVDLDVKVGVLARQRVARVGHPSVSDRSRRVGGQLAELGELQHSQDFQPNSHTGVLGSRPLMNRHAAPGPPMGCPYVAVGMHRPLDSAIGLHSRPTSA